MAEYNREEHALRPEELRKESLRALARLIADLCKARGLTYELLASRARVPIEWLYLVIAADLLALEGLSQARVKRLDRALRSTAGRLARAFPLNDLPARAKPRRRKPKKA